MELSDYLRVLRKFWISIAAVVLIGLAGGAIVSLLATPTYTSSASLFLTVQTADSAGELASGSSYTERQVKSFAEVAEAPVVLQPVIDGLGLDVTPAALAQRVTVSVPTNTSILDVAVVDTDPQRAAATAQAIAEGLVATVAEVAPKDGTGQATVQARIISPSTVPTAWTSPKVAQNLLLGALVGAFLGVGQGLLRHVLDTRVRTAEDVDAVTDVPLVGTVGFDATAATHPLVVATDPNSLRAEDFRRLRTNLQFLAVAERGRSIAFSSAVAGEGKTTTTINAGLALAAAGRRVLVVDADLRRPRVADRLNLEGAVGLTTVLIGRAELEDVVQPVFDGTMHVLPAGQVPPNPSELLGSEAMRRLVAQATAAYDYVLLDSAPMVPVADTAVLSSMLGGVVVVVGSGDVHAAQLGEAIDSVRAAEGEVLGVVLNKLKVEDAGYRSALYYRREGYSDAEAQPSASPRRGKQQAPAARAL